MLTGTGTGIFLPRGDGYGKITPDGEIPIAISRPGASEEGSIRGTLDQFTTLPKMMIEGANSKGHRVPHRLRGNSKAPSDHQPQEAEAPGASAEDSEINQEVSFACFAVRTKAIPPGCACYHPEAKGNSRSRSTASSAEAGHAYCFVSFTLHPRICGQPPCSFCCFGESTSSFLATASAST
jgi:hypothetical protein